MSSSRTCALAVVLVALGARAQTPVQGFAVDRFYPSAPGAGWFLVDSLDMHGGLGGAMSFTARYAHDALVIDRSSTDRLPVVTDAALGQVAGTITWWRLRFSLSFDFPFAMKGQTGSARGYDYTAPDLDLGSHPDTISDLRVGADARLLGGPQDRFRLGLGAQLWIPSGLREDYLTDGTFRGMVRALFAGDVGWFAYAGHLGVHIRPLDENGVPGAPHGSELLFAVAGGPKFAVGDGFRIVVGPEVSGATAFHAFFHSDATSAEALLSARFEGARESGAQLRVKLGGGLGLNTGSQTAEWRLVAQVEIFTFGAGEK
jgi:hypothetical protein